MKKNYRLETRLVVAKDWEHVGLHGKEVVLVKDPQDENI